MASATVLIVTADRHDADRYAEALLRAEEFAFVFAPDARTALDYATNALPDLAIIALEGEQGIQLCRSFRETPEAANMRLLLVLEREQLSAARGSALNGIVVEPASPVVVTSEALGVLRREERRSMNHPDRRVSHRGGRRMTDVTPVDDATL
jgi:DNA-binding response OmpR family regulator